jgi:hypothetical protein
VPIFSYFTIVGSELAALLYWASGTVTPAPLPFSTQVAGLPDAGTRAAGRSDMRDAGKITSGPTPTVAAVAVEPTVKASPPAAAAKPPARTKAVRTAKKQPAKQRPSRFAETPIPARNFGLFN